MKINKLLALVGFGMMTTGAWAQTDVTSTYLTNADFSQGTVYTDKVYGYGHDGSPWGFQEVEGWTINVVDGDDDNGHPNSAMAGAIFSYGTTTGMLQGGGKTPPSVGPTDNEGNCLGLVAVWGKGGYYYQEVTFPAGEYTINIPVYNQQGTNGTTTYFGFIPNSGTSQTIATPTTTGAWETLTKSFTLTAETAGRICLGYKSNGSGSGANPHLFVDKVQILYKAVVVKDVLLNAITAATAANNVLADENLTQAIAAATIVSNSSSATQEQVNTAAAELNAAVEVAMDGKDVTDIFLTNADMSSQEGWTPVISQQYRDYGNGLIGEYNVRFSAATVDETHLATEYCFGVECRWNSNFASFTQTTATLPAGVYTFTYDVENVNGATTAGTYNNLFFAQVGGTKFNDNSTEWMQGNSAWTTHTITATLNEASPLTLSLGYGNDRNLAADNTPAIYVSHLKMTYSSFLAGAQKAWQEAGQDATEAIAANPNVTGSEKAALVAACSETPEATVEGYNAAAEKITAATETLVAAAPAYNAHVTEIAYAKTIGVDTKAAEAAAASSETTAATIVTATHELKVLEYTTISNAYANDVTSLLGTWGKGNYDTTSGQGYVGSESYFDKWSGSATDLSSSATVTLPAGKYVVKVAGRGISTTTMNLSVKVGEADAVSTPFLLGGDAGKGIDTAGATNFSEEGTYSNNNVGRGWQYRYITFETTGEDVTITINGHLNASTWQSFYAPVLLCDDATYAPIAVDAAKADLQAAIDAAPAVLTVNIGDGVFQIAEAGVTTYSSALAAAQIAHDADDATIASIKRAQADLAAAIEAYNALEVNAPDANKAYNVLVATEGHAKWGNALLLAPGATTANNPTGYTMTANFAPNANLNQGVKFTKVSGNNYIISFETAEGTAYLTYGTTNGSAASWKDSQIQATTDAEKKGEFLIKPSTTEGAFNIYNTLTNSTIACQAGGNIYTEAGNADFTLGAEEVAKASITINTTAAGWGTVMLPFEVASLPDGVKAYSCAAVADDVLTLEPVTELAANTPYIIEGAWNETLTGDAKGTALTYTAGLLTGVYANTEAVAGSYVLQNQADGVGFYKVEEVKPTVGANRAYLTYEAPAEGGEVKFFRLGDTTTAVNTVKVAGNSAAIYNLAGQRVNGAQKGIYIVNGKKVIK